MNKSKFDLVFNYISKKHDKQVRKNGEPYINHLTRVYEIVKNSGYDDLYQAVALLHDVLEDTDATEDELDLLYDMQIAYCVKALTRSTKYERKYVNKVLEYKVTAVVKSADIIDNMISAGIIARDPKHRRWATNYIKKAEKYYKNKFCKAVDNAIDLAIKITNEGIKYDEAIKIIGKIEY